MLGRMSQTPRPRRSCLAVPGSNPRFLEKAKANGEVRDWTSRRTLDPAAHTITLTGELNGAPSARWAAASDLLSASPDDNAFVVEVESDGSACLRFGDGVNGKAPATATAFTAAYRVGNGAAGNVEQTPMVVPVK